MRPRDSAATGPAEYFNALFKDETFVEYHHHQTTLLNAGFRNKHPYTLPDGWITHSGLCTTCEVLINLPYTLLRDVDHVPEYEWMIRAAEYGCFYCTQVLQRLAKVIEYNGFPITSYFPMRAMVDDRHIAFKGAYTGDGWHFWFRKAILKLSSSSQPSISNICHRFGNTPELREQIRSWMTTCISEHKACSSTIAVSPTRLLYVGNAQEHGVLRLVEPVAPVRYLTLSYCW